MSSELPHKKKYVFFVKKNLIYYIISKEFPLFCVFVEWIFFFFYDCVFILFSFQAETDKLLFTYCSDPQLVCATVQCGKLATITLLYSLFTYIGRDAAVEEHWDSLREL